MTLFKTKVSATTSSVDESYSLKEAIGERAKVLLLLVIDTLFIAGWVALVWALETYLLSKLEDFTGLDGAILTSLKYILGVPVILSAASFTLLDLSTTVRSTFKRIRGQWRN